MKLPYLVDLTQERLHQLVSYEPDTGVFRWKQRLNDRIRVGDVAGTVTNGYVVICIESVKYRAHRLAWLYVHGEWPITEIDHINMDRGDNRWSNLRLASSSQNKQNRSLQANNTTGVRGVTKYGARFRAQIKYYGRYKSLGYFDTLERAEEFRQLVADMLYGSFARHA